MKLYDVYDGIIIVVRSSPSSLRSRKSFDSQDSSPFANKQRTRHSFDTVDSFVSVVRPTNNGDRTDRCVALRVAYSKTGCIEEIERPRSFSRRKL